MRLADLAEELGCELRGDGDIEIAGVAPIESAGRGQLTFVANPRYARHLRTTQASAVILPSDAPEVRLASLRGSDPYFAFARAIELFYRPIASPPGVHPTAVIAASARIGAGASIGAYCVIGDGVAIGEGARMAPHVVIYPEVAIGDRFIAHAHVTVRERVRVGNDVILHAGVVIGSDGFGYVASPDGRVHKIIQGGDVLLEDHVEVGANTTIDRAAVGSTVIRRGAKLDNLVMIAHGCEVGESTMIAAQVGLSGSTRVGRGVRIGGQAGTAGHLSIGDGAQLAARSGVVGSIDAGMVVGGFPAVEAPRWRRVTAALARLPELLRRVRRIEKRLNLTDEAGEEP